MSEDSDREIELVVAELIQKGWVIQEELCAQVGIGENLLEVCLTWELVDSPEVNAEGQRVFPAEAVDRLATGLRLHRDLGVNWAGVSVILRLLDRLGELERRTYLRMFFPEG